MTHFGIWRFALPPFALLDVPAVTGEAPTADTPPPSDEGSLSDHEAAFGTDTRSARQPDPEPAAEPAADTRERDETGKFVKPTEKTRHRAKSQQASPEDVPRIAELTRRLREAEAERDSLRTGRAPQREEPKPAATAADRFPKFETWLTQPGNGEKDFDDWLDARDEHAYARRREAEHRAASEQAESRAITAAERAFESKVAAAREKYPDFDDVVTGDIQVSLVLQRAVLEVGPDAAYWLATHPQERDELSEDSLARPSEPGFAVAVKAMRRYLTSLVAAEQRPSPSRAAAGSTGAALAPMPKPAPKPPTPVRTSALRAADEPPGDDEGLAAHERFFGPKARRA